MTPTTETETLSSGAHALTRTHDPRENDAQLDTTYNEGRPAAENTLAVTPKDQVAPDGPAVKIGDLARLTINRAGTVRLAWGIITGVGSRVPGAPTGDNGEPLITVVFLDSLNLRTLSSASWADGFRRVGPVHHASSPAAESGVTYTDVLPMDASGAINLAAAEIPDVTAAAAAEVQRKEAMGVGRGPVPDKDIAYQTATASGIAEESAIKGTHETEAPTAPMPTGRSGGPYVHTPTPEWPPKTAKIGVPLQPGDRRPTPVPASGVSTASGGLKAAPSTVNLEESQKAAEASPATRSRAESILGGLKPASETTKAPA